MNHRMLEGEGEVETLDWAERVTNRHVLRAARWTWSRDLGPSQEGHELSRAEKLRRERNLGHAERILYPRVLKSWGWDLALQKVTPFLLKGWDLDDIERVSYHYEAAILITSSGSHTITHRRITCDRQNWKNISTIVSL